MIRYLVPVVLITLLLGAFAKGLWKDPTVIPSPLIGTPVPQFQLPRLDDLGASMSTNDFSGKMVLVNIWASWCEACRKEHPFLMELSSTQSIPIYGLNYLDTQDEALSVIRKLGNPFVVSGYDEDGNVGEAFGVYAAPETFLIDAEGKILYKHTGALTREIWQSEFLPRVAEAGVKGVERY